MLIVLFIANICLLLVASNECNSIFECVQCTESPECTWCADATLQEAVEEEILSWPPPSSSISPSLVPSSESSPQGTNWVSNGETSSSSSATATAADESPSSSMTGGGTSLVTAASATASASDAEPPTSPSPSLYTVVEPSNIDSVSFGTLGTLSTATVPFSSSEVPSATVTAPSSTSPPTMAPTTASPTHNPTQSPTTPVPTPQPTTPLPTPSPTTAPSSAPTIAPSVGTFAPTVAPTVAPSQAPSVDTFAPTSAPSSAPSAPTPVPSVTPPPPPSCATPQPGAPTRPPHCYCPPPPFVPPPPSCLDSTEASKASSATRVTALGTPKALRKRKRNVSGAGGAGLTFDDVWRDPVDWLRESFSASQIRDFAERVRPYLAPSVLQLSSREVALMSADERARTLLGGGSREDVEKRLHLFIATHMGRKQPRPLLKRNEEQLGEALLPPCLSAEQAETVSCYDFSPPNIRVLNPDLCLVQGDLGFLEPLAVERLHEKGAFEEGVDVVESIVGMEPESEPTAGPSSPIPIIVGASLGVFAGVCLVIVLFVVLRRRNSASAAAAHGPGTRSPSGSMELTSSDLSADPAGGGHRRRSRSNSRSRTKRKEAVSQYGPVPELFATTNYEIVPGDGGGGSTGGLQPIYDTVNDLGPEGTMQQRRKAPSSVLYEQLPPPGDSNRQSVYDSVPLNAQVAQKKPAASQLYDSVESDASRMSQYGPIAPVKDMEAGKGPDPRLSQYGKAPVLAGTTPLYAELQMGTGDVYDKVDTGDMLPADPTYDAAMDKFHTGGSTESAASRSRSNKSEKKSKK